MKKDTEIKKAIECIACEYIRYGYPRITQELKRRGFSINHKKVYRLMKEMKLLCKKQKKKHSTTDSNHGFGIYPNLIKDTKTTGLNQIWVSDITYIKVKEKFWYLAAILDKYSRRIVGDSLSDRIDGELCLKALEDALSQRSAPLIHHSDRGVQYASEEYTKKLKSFGIKISMSSKGNPYDNANMESFFKTFKVEEIYVSEYDSEFDMMISVKEYIKKYNEKRLHSSIGYVPPVEYEEALNLKLQGSINIV